MEAEVGFGSTERREKREREREKENLGDVSILSEWMEPVPGMYADLT